MNSKGIQTKFFNSIADFLKMATAIDLTVIVYYYPSITAPDWATQALWQAQPFDALLFRFSSPFPLLFWLATLAF